MDSEASWFFFRAARFGTLDDVISHSGKPGVDVNWEDGKGSTPLRVACELGRGEVVKFLCTLSQLDCNSPNKKGWTPLYLACQKGHRRIVEFLLADPRVDVNKPDNIGATPFYSACASGHVEIVSLLLADPRVDPNRSKKDDRSTPFSIACSNGHVEIVSLLLADRRIRVNEHMADGSSPLWNASQNGHVGVVQHILASGREIDTRKESTFNKNTAAMQARATGARTAKQWNESDEVYARRCQNCLVIADLIDTFDKNPSATQAWLRGVLGIADRWIEEFLGIPVSFCAGVTPPNRRNSSQVQSLHFSDCSLTSVPRSIEKFTNLIEVDLSHNPFGDEASAEVISNLVKGNDQLKSLNVSSTNIGPKGMLLILQALVWKFSQENFRLQSLEVEDMPLDSFGGLGIIPIDILRLGSVKIVRYLLDLFQSPEADPLFRSKLMVVGFAEIGKTSLLECLFPLTGILMAKDVKKRLLKKDKDVWAHCSLSLVGNNFTQKELNPAAKFGSVRGKVPKDTGTVLLSKGAGWSIDRIDDPENLGFRIVGPNDFVSELKCADRAERDRWVARIEELLKRDRTHGIDIQEIDISSHEVVKRYLDANHLKGKVELSVWDFAGQHDYYNHHQHFLSTRSVFLVLWNLTEFDEAADVAASQEQRGKPKQGKGIQGLEFWLWSLSFHLHQQQQEKADSGNYHAREYFKIMVVGTHFDRLSEREQNKMAIRKSVVERLCEKYGLRLGPGNYLEVSCVDDLVNIAELRHMVFEETLQMKYMGERIPLSYLLVESHLKSLLTQHRGFPLVDIRLFFEHFPERIVRDALSLLHDWGKCVYFGNDERLRDQVVLDPQFLSKVTLAGFFRLGKEAEEKRRNGVIHHSDLKTFWTEPPPASPLLSTPRSSLVRRDDFWETAELLITFMEKFDVCFVLPEERERPFKDQRSILPSLLPTRKNDRVIKIQRRAVHDEMIALQAEIDVLKPECEYNSRQLSRNALTEIGIADFRVLEQRMREKKELLEEFQGQLEVLDSELVAAQVWARYWGDELEAGHNVQFERVFQFGNVPAELVSRMLARLHTMIQGECVTRDCALLRNPKDGTQAKVTVDISLDQFVIEIRSASLDSGERMLNEIKGSISKVLNLYPEITVPASSVDSVKSGGRSPGRTVIAPQVVEGVRNPSSDRVIPLEMIRDAKERDLVVREGGSEYTILVLKLKEIAGLVAPTPLTKRQVFKGSSEWDDLVKLFRYLGGEAGQIKQAYDIEDPDYRLMFESTRKSYFQQQRDSPGKFNKDFRRELKNDIGLRDQYLQLFRAKQQQSMSISSSICRDEDEKSRAVVMIHGTSESDGQKIARGGFGIVSSLDDGFYGQGIYFTSRVDYSISYANLHQKPVLVISVINPGNVFPVTEHPHGPGTGYVPADKVTNDSNDELVVFERAQALPKYLVYYK